MTGDGEWSYDDGTAERGPLDLATLGQMRDAGLVSGGTRVRPAAGGPWRRLDDAIMGLESGPTTFGDDAHQEIAEAAPSAGPKLPPRTESTRSAAPNLPPLETYYAAGPGGQPEGPYTVAQLAEMLAGGRLSPATQIARDGGDRWVPVESVVGHAHTAVPAEVVRRDAVKAVVLSFLTLGIYWVCYLVPCYTRDMAAITAKPRLNFALAVVMGALGYLAPMVLLLLMAGVDEAGQGLVAMLIGVPSTILACVYAFELERIGKERRTAGAHQSIGWLFLGLVVASAASELLPGSFGVVVGIAIAIYPIYILQRELNLYAKTPV
ncbi:MAG TPA: DUF4339 domain-containing protein [Verrucomicrobiae bacterium]|nr:DUF4339 domain-containing protein [Verrucomicrobiae bacterium]